MDGKLACETLASCLSIVGGGLLSYDAIRADKNLRIRSGARRILAALRRKEKTEALKDQNGAPLSNEKTVELWLARRSVRLNQAGFLLMTLGFVADISAKYVCR